MCRPASFVIADNGKRAYWSKLTDSHEKIIREHGLVERVAGKIPFVRVEIAPDDGNLTTPFDQWKFQTDQDLLPDWYDPQEAEKLCRSELPAWFESKVFIDGEHEVYGGISYAYARAKLIVKDGGAAVVRGGSAEVYSGGSAEVRGGSAEVYSGGSVVVYSGGSAVVRGGSAEVWGGSAVVRGGSAEVWGGSAVGKENATIINYTSNKIPLEDNAVCIDRSGEKPVIHVAGE